MGPRELVKREQIMRLGKYLTAIAAASMVVAPAMAAPSNPAASLSVANSARVGAPVANANDTRGRRRGGAIIIALLAAAAVIAGIIIAADSDDSPRSR